MNNSGEISNVSQHIVVNTYYAVGVSRRQFENITIVSKMSTFWNFMNIFGITMRNRLK